MNVKVNKKIGCGAYGSIYKTTIDGETAITKLEEYDGDLSFKSQYMRQIEFAELANKYPNNFLTLISSGIIENYCGPIKKTVKRNKPNKNKKRNKECSDIKTIIMTKKNDKKYCVLSYKPVLNYTLDDVFYDLNQKEYYNMLRSIIITIDIMRNAGYKHNDIHLNNIMSNGSKWYLIDYGLISNDKYPKNNYDKEAATKTDILSLLWCTIEDNVYNYITGNNIYVDYGKFLQKCKKIIKKESLENYLPETNNKYLLNRSIIMVITLLRFELYMKILNIDREENPELFTEQRYDIKPMLYIIKHSADDNYKKIIKYLDNYC